MKYFVACPWYVHVSFSCRVNGLEIRDPGMPMTPVLS